MRQNCVASDAEQFIVHKPHVIVPEIPPCDYVEVVMSVTVVAEQVQDVLEVEAQRGVLLFLVMNVRLQSNWEVVFVIRHGNTKKPSIRRGLGRAPRRKWLSMVKREIS